MSAFLQLQRIYLRTTKKHLRYGNIIRHSLKLSTFGEPAGLQKNKKQPSQLQSAPFAYKNLQMTTNTDITSLFAPCKTHY